MPEKFVVALIVLVSIIVSCPLSIAAEKASRLATGSEKGVYYPLGNGIAEAGKLNGVDIQVVPTSGSIENVRLLESRQADMALVQSDIAYDAFHGKGKFKEPIRTLKAVAILHAEAVHILVREGLHIAKIEEIKGKRVSLGPRGGGTESSAIAILGAGGVTPEEIEPLFLSFEESIEHLRDNRIDVAFIATGIPAKVVEDIYASRIATLLSLNSHILERLVRVEKYPRYVSMAVPEGTYRSQTADIQAIGVRALLVASEDTPDAAVRSVLEAMYANKSLLVKHFARAEIVIPPTLEEFPLDVHPGARERYIHMGIGEAKYGLWIVLTTILAALFFVRDKVWAAWLLIKKYDLAKIILVFIVVYFAGSFCLYLFEHRVNEYFSTVPKALWSVIVYVAGGFQAREPITELGNIAGIVVVVVETGIAAWFTAELAASFVKRKLEKKPMVELKDHVVILNWDDRVESILNQLCGGDLRKRLSIVIMTPEKAPDIHNDKYRGIHHMLGDITNPAHLEKRTHVYNARSVLIVSDPLDPLSDARCIMAILAVRKICDEKNKDQVPITAEIKDWKNFDLAKHAGCQYAGKIEVISSSRLGANLLTQCAVTPGIAELYDDLLTFRKNTNEIYKMELPEECRGKRFSELSEWFLKRRTEGKMCAIPVGISRNDATHINPADSEVGPLQSSDHIFVISDAVPQA